MRKIQFLALIILGILLYNVHVAHSLGNTPPTTIVPTNAAIPQPVMPEVPDVGHDSDEYDMVSNESLTPPSSLSPDNSPPLSGVDIPNRDDILISALPHGLSSDDENKSVSPNSDDPNIGDLLDYISSIPTAKSKSDINDAPDDIPMIEQPSSEPDPKPISENDFDPNDDLPNDISASDLPDGFVFSSSSDSSPDLSPGFNAMPIPSDNDLSPDTDASGSSLSSDAENAVEGPILPTPGLLSSSSSDDDMPVLPTTPVINPLVAPDNLDMSLVLLPSPEIVPILPIVGEPSALDLLSLSPIASTISPPVSPTFIPMADGHIVLDSQSSSDSKDDDDSSSDSTDSSPEGSGYFADSNDNIPDSSSSSDSPPDYPTDNDSDSYPNPYESFWFNEPDLKLSPVNPPFIAVQPLPAPAAPIAPIAIPIVIPPVPVIRYIHLPAPPAPPPIIINNTQYRYIDTIKYIKLNGPINYIYRNRYWMSINIYPHVMPKINYWDIEYLYSWNTNYYNKNKKRKRVRIKVHHLHGHTLIGSCIYP